MLLAVGALAATRLLLLVLLAARELPLPAGSAAFFVLGAFALRLFADVGDALLFFTASDEAASTGAAKEPIPWQSRHNNKTDVRNNGFLSKISSRSNHRLARDVVQPTLQTAKSPLYDSKALTGTLRQSCIHGNHHRYIRSPFPLCGWALFPAVLAAVGRGRVRPLPIPGEAYRLVLAGMS